MALDHASTDTVQVNVATVDGNAKAGKDYIALSGVLSFLPGQTSKPVKVNVTGDAVAEANEKFYLQLLSTKYGVLGSRASATCTIVNDDGTSRMGIEGVDSVATLITGSIALYPNPAKNTLFLQGLPATAASISVVDMWGKILFSQQAIGSLCQVDISRLPAGTFYVLVKNGNATERIKFIKE